MIRIISALILAVAANLAHAAEEQPLKLADSAPSQHVVVRGDTLWDISAKFLKDPWRWPEIWRMNKAEIANPHWIYPGDVIILEHDANGNPYLRLQESKVHPKIYSEQVKEAIPPIPPNVIEPFISAPLVIEKDGLDSAARVVATGQERVFAGNGDIIYVNDAAPDQKQWYVYRSGQPLRDPEDRERILGYEAFYLGSATQTLPGEPATFRVETAKQEIGQGDRLMPASRPALVDYIPHRPETKFDGRIVSVYGGVGMGGRLSVISVNLGAQDNAEVGHVLSLERNRKVTERDPDGRKKEVTIPAVRYGLAFIFRTFEHISYALVVQADVPVEVNDFVRTP